jgi:HK97 family phage portal protein
LLAESLAQLPLDLFKRADKGQRDAAINHPLYDVLRYQPNGFQTPYEYRETLQLAAGLRGNGYSYIERASDGNVAALWPVHNDKVVVCKGQDLLPYYQVGAYPDRLPMRQMHHVRWHSQNFYEGMSPILLHAEAVGLAQAVRQYTGKSFANGVSVSGVIERPQESAAIKDQGSIDRILDQWGNKFGGMDNAKKVALLQEGMTFKPVSMTNVDAEILGVLKLSGVDCARIYKIPLPMVNDLDKANYNTIEQLLIQFVVFGLMPWVKRHEQAMMRDFLLPADRRGYFIEFNLSGLMRGDQKSRYEAYAIARQWGWLSVNDIRRLENIPAAAQHDQRGQAAARCQRPGRARAARAAAARDREDARPMKNYLRASSLLFNQPLLVIPDMLDLGVRWANQAMSLNIVNIGAPDSARLWADDGVDLVAQREEQRRTTIASTGVEVIPVSGVLVSRGSHIGLCETMTSYESLRAQISQAVADPMVEQVVLDIDSPGGAAVGAFELAADIREMSRQKPIAGLVNYMAYSGGYLIGAACSELVVSQTSGVGSIGVIASHMDRSKMEEGMGVKVTTVYAGAHKNDLSPHEPLTEQSLRYLNEVVQESYQLFVNAIADYRGLSVQQVMATEARLYRGQQGIQAGLADRMQSPQKTVNEFSRAVALSRANRQSARIGVRAAALTMQTLI